MKIIRNFGPDAVVGVGGYASAPTVLCGFFAVCRRRYANRIPFRDSQQDPLEIRGEDSDNLRREPNAFPRTKTVLTGNPIRRELALRAAEKKPGRGPRAGSVRAGRKPGGEKAEQVVPRALAETGRELRVFHQTGEADRAEVERTYGELGMEAEVFAFTGDMSRVYGRTDVIICRAGAGTIAEVTAFSIPSILIPLASSTHGHQLANARFAERNGAAVVIEEEELDAAGLAEALGKTLEPATLAEMASSAGKLGRPGAAKEIVDEIEKLAGRD